MKRFILFLAAILCSLSSFALTFEGVEIKGTAQAFSDSLAANGFPFDGKDENFRLHHGKIMDQDVEIFVESTKNDRIELIGVSINFENYDTILPIHDYFYEIMQKYFGDAFYSFDPRKSPTKDLYQLMEIDPNSIMLHNWKDQEYNVIIDLKSSPWQLKIFYKPL